MAENFDLIFGQSASSQYAWNDSDYQNGWETVGSTPPTAEQFDALQRRSDKKAQELNNALTPLVNQNTASNRQPLTTYALKDIRYSPLLPVGWYLECTTNGITSSGDITLPTPLVENATITDGTVTWKVRKISSADGMPIGAIIAYGGNGNIPSGYLLCDGAAYSRTAFPDLFAAIGTDYGSGDGTSTFNVPDSNQAKRFLQGDTVAGQAKSAGLPNITGANLYITHDTTSVGTGALSATNTQLGKAQISTADEGWREGTLSFDASRSNSIYGNSTTVQPHALTTRYIIKAFDGQTADSALIDITQYESRLEHKADINGSNMVHHKDVITTSGTYTAPATGLYKITVKGGGGGGSGSSATHNYARGGAGGGEGGTTIAFVKMIENDTATVVIGAGGAGGTALYDVSQLTGGSDGGNTTVTIDGTTYTGGHGYGGIGSGGYGGAGDIAGACGQSCQAYTAQGQYGGSGGGAGGGKGGSAGGNGIAGIAGGGGGAGGATIGQAYAGGAGGNGYVWFEYYTTGA